MVRWMVGRMDSAHQYIYINRWWLPKIAQHIWHMAPLYNTHSFFLSFSWWRKKSKKWDTLSFWVSTLLIKFFLFFLKIQSAFYLRTIAFQKNVFKSNFSNTLMCWKRFHSKISFVFFHFIFFLFENLNLERWLFHHHHIYTHTRTHCSIEFIQHLHTNRDRE